MRPAIGSLVAPKMRAPTDAKAVTPREDYVVVRVDDEAQWEAQLLRHPCRNVYTSWGWGEYKARLGWSVERLLVKNKAGESLGMAQVQRRGRFGFRQAYIHGGPLFFATDDTVVERTLASLLAYLDAGRFGAVVINFERFETPDALLAALACGLAPALNRAQHTIVLDMSIGLDAIRKGMRRLWARQLSKALANGDLSTHIADTPEERAEAFDAFARMYDDLARRKGFDMAIDPDRFRDIAIADRRYIFLVVRERGTIVTVRLAHSSRDRVIDFVTASGAQALAHNASTLAVWRLIQHGVESGLRYYDFCGIDAVANPGVFRFKRGLGADAVQSGPLWLYARSRLVRAALQVLLTLR